LKILFISYDFPYPPTGGSISRDYNLIRQLAKHHELHWVNRTITGEVKAEHAEEMEKYFKTMEIVPWDYRNSIPGFIKSFFTGKPYIIYRFKSPEMEEIVRKKISDDNFDLILCDHIYLQQYLPDNIQKNIPIIPSNEDNGYTYYKRMAEHTNLFRLLYGRSQWKKMLNYEVKVYNKYKAYITTSDNEKLNMKDYLKNVQIKVISNGVDINYYNSIQRTDFDPKVIYTGWFGYYPNVDAAMDFANNIFPLAKEKIPDLKFYVAGKMPSKELYKLQYTEGVIVTGYVDDMREYVKNSDALVVPLKVGGGTRLKILEAMSMGVPVISTSLGAEGLRVTDGKDILMANTKEEFAEKINLVINDKMFAHKISENARKLVEEEYTWEKIGDELNDFLEEFVNETREKN
jgi:sugar transferase (PEP-CTERM/EpsH1 system associated)